MNQFKDIGNGVKEGWKGLSKSKKIGLITILTSIVAIASSLTYYAQRVEYTTLFSNLEDADAGTIVNDLDSQGIAYKLEDNGSTILIDAEQVDKYRIQLAVDGLLPKTATGFEIFDKTSMMATDEDRKIMYQRAVTGELERTISALDSVESANVILSIPEENVFATDKKGQEGSASVMIATKTGQELPASAIQGIASLISGAVDNLPKTNIKIVDTNGNDLSGVLQDGQNADATDLVSRYQKIKNNYEDELEKKLMDTLSPIYGAENLSISLNVDLDFDSVEKEIVDYGEAAIRSQSTSKTGDAQAQTGASANANTASAAATSGEDGTSSTYDQTTNNELDTVTTKIANAPGSLKRLTATVIYNGNLDASQALQLENATKTTIGYDANRDDQVAVEGIEFVKQTEKIAPETVSAEANLTAYVQKYGVYFAGGLGISILLMVLIILLRKTKKDDYQEDAFKGYQEPFTVAQPEPQIHIPPAKKTETIPTSVEIQVNGKEDRFRTYAKENPEMVADLIKIWMKDK